MAMCGAVVGTAWNGITHWNVWNHTNLTWGRLWGQIQVAPARVGWGTVPPTQGERQGWHKGQFSLPLKTNLNPNLRWSGRGRKNSSDDNKTPVLNPAPECPVPTMANL